MNDTLATRILLDWWQSMRGQRPMPARADLDPAALKSILPNLMLIDVRPDVAAQDHVFTCRLAGTEIDNRFGIKLTGLRLEEVPLGDALASIRRQYETAIAEARPVFCSHSVMVGSERYVEYDRVVVPLGGAEGEVKALAAAIDFKCAYLVTQGRPPACAHPHHCDRIDLCLTRIRLP